MLPDHKLRTTGEDKTKEEELGSSSWNEWKPFLYGRLRVISLDPETEKLLKSWYLLRRELQQKKITVEQFDERRKELFLGRDYFFEDRLHIDALGLITEATKPGN